MRYYEFAIRGVAKEIKELVQNKECLREHRYGSPIWSVNSYMYRNLKNNVGFLAYRQETDDKILSVLFLDEKRETLEKAYDYISEVLEGVFEIKRIQLSPSEITMYEFMDCYREAQRRDYDNHGNRFIQMSNLFIYEYYMDNSKSYHFKFDEKIIPETKKGKMEIYDKEFLEELLNIESHTNNTEHKGNLVHYIISSRSVEAAHDMSEILAQFLVKANRISGRRMEVISEIEPDLYKFNNRLEDIIENNYGGVIVFDLSEKFGCDPVDYQITCK